jgi:hypothetical protein
MMPRQSAAKRRFSLKCAGKVVGFAACGTHRAAEWRWAAKYTSVDIKNFDGKGFVSGGGNHVTTHTFGHHVYFGTWHSRSSDT